MKFFKHEVRGKILSCGSLLLVLGRYDILEVWCKTNEFSLHAHCFLWGLNAKYRAHPGANNITLCKHWTALKYPALHCAIQTLLHCTWLQHAAVISTEPKRSLSLLWGFTLPFQPLLVFLVYYTSTALHCLSLLLILHTLYSKNVPNKWQTLIL